MFPSLNRAVIIDDDYISLYLITKLFNEKQIAETTLPFTNGPDALNYLSNNAQNSCLLPEIIFLDSKMPDMNGWQFINKLANIEFITGYEPAICIISADVTIDNDILSHPYVRAFFPKPIQANRLLKVLELLVMDIENTGDVQKNIKAAIPQLL